MSLRALSLMEPWATAMADGHKLIETRSRATHHRGWLALHASQRRPRGVDSMTRKWPFNEWMKPWQWEHLPSGEIIAVGYLAACIEAEAMQSLLLADGRQGEVNRLFYRSTEDLELAKVEIGLGDYSAKRFAWQFRRVVKLRKPVAAKGALGFWPVRPDAERLVRAQLPAHLLEGL